MTRAERDKLAADIRAQLAGGFRRRGRAHWATLAVEYLHQILAALEDAEAETDALYVALLRASSTQTVTNRESGGASPAGAPGASTEPEAPEAPRPPALDKPGGASPSSWSDAWIDPAAEPAAPARPARKDAHGQETHGGGDPRQHQRRLREHDAPLPCVRNAADAGPGGRLPVHDEGGEAEATARGAGERLGASARDALTPPPALDRPGGEFGADLPPCPFCGGGRAFLQEESYGPRDGWRVVCACGAKGPWWQEKHAAFDAWNSRVIDTYPDPPSESELARRSSWSDAGFPRPRRP